MISGEINYNNCLNLAADPDPKKSIGNHCETYFEIGHYLLSVRDEELAEQYFNQCIETGKSDYNEYVFARVSINKTKELKKTNQYLLQINPQSIAFFIWP